MLHDNWSEHSTLQEHHVFSGPNRTNSEENGLKIYLCRDHHIYGPEAIHNNARIRHEVQRMAQREFERQHSHKEFMKIFGRNYLDLVEIGENNEKKSKVIIGIVAAVAVLGGGYTVSRMDFIGTGKVGIVYNYKDGVQDKVLIPGMHFIAPMNKVKEFSTSNEILVLTKDKRDGSKEDDSFKVATSDDASIAVSFQMSYRYDPDTVIDTYKRFKGMDGEDIIENRVKTVLKSKISEITTNYSMMDIYSGNRSELNNAITEYLNKDFHKKYGIEVLDASIVDVHPDKKLKQAIDNRVTALQEKQQAQAEQEKVKVQKETEKLQAEADAQIELTKAEADAKKAKVKAAAEAENTKIKAKAQAEANNELSASITDELIKMKEAEAHYKNGWVTVQGADAVIADK